MSRPGNLITLKEIRCLACYGHGEIIDKFDQAKRTRCACQSAWPNRWPCPCLAGIETIPNKGLYNKYRIEKASGEPIDPKAQYFVLRIDTDLAAKKAMLTYADEMKKGGEIDFAHHIWKWVNSGGGGGRMFDRGRSGQSEA